MRLSISCKFNRFDLLLSLLVVLAATALAFFFLSRTGRGEAGAVTIRDGGSEPYSVTLDAPRRVQLAQGHITLVIEKDGVYVEYADCPTQDCVRTGKITRAGESIVCLPNRVVVTLEGKAAFDAVTG